mmetsp:Transcript_128979/g.237292  ORF Transcript_128979/g.237292 Transcript_128979/m.237292 type:complete len:268 (-) Transcript_128979:108-911(-)
MERFFWEKRSAFLDGLLASGSGTGLMGTLPSSEELECSLASLEKAADSTLPRVGSLFSESVSEASPSEVSKASLVTGVVADRSMVFSPFGDRDRESCPLSLDLPRLRLLGREEPGRSFFSGSSPAVLSPPSLLLQSCTRSPAFSSWICSEVAPLMQDSPFTTMPPFAFFLLSQDFVRCRMASPPPRAFGGLSFSFSSRSSFVFMLCRVFSFRWRSFAGICSGEVLSSASPVASAALLSLVAFKDRPRGRPVLLWLWLWLMTIVWLWL